MWKAYDPLKNLRRPLLPVAVEMTLFLYITIPDIIVYSSPSLGRRWLIFNSQNFVFGSTLAVGFA